jgi:SNF2 family DNA or RNA helicase
MSYKNRDKYIDLKINGRLFPTYLLANFKEYKLDEIALGDTDPCTIVKTNKELLKYQVFLGKYLDFNSPYKNLLIYHGLGSGKTRSAINVYNVLYNYNPGWNVFILLPASLKPNWEDELARFLEKEDKESRRANITFISFNASNADKAFMEAIQNADTSKKNLFIIDEVHKFIGNVYSNISSKQGKRAQNIYEYIIQDQQENSDTRVVVLSATPAANNPYELALLFNLLRPNIFPKSETQFNQEFISSSNFRSINPINKNLFQRRILGLVSYYYGSTPDYFATQKTEFVYVKMDKYQEDIYGHFEKEEEKIARRKAKSKGIDIQKLKTYTRQACNFVFPYMGQGLTGEARPRPKNFKLSEKMGQELLEGRLDKEKDKEKYYSAQGYFDAIGKYAKSFERIIDDLNVEDEKVKHTIKDDIKICKEKYEGNYEKFHKEEEKKSKVYEKLHECSAKMLYILFIMMNSQGPILVYSNYVLMEGIQIFKIYMKYFGYAHLDSTINDKKYDGKRFAEYHGQIDKDKRYNVIKTFQKEENKYGDVCRVILISPAGAEGLNLYSIRQVHIMEPYWQEVRINQTIGRAVRWCGHKFLPKNERHVDIYRYKSVREEYPKAKWTSDQSIEDTSRGKQGLIQSFLDAMREAAIDCMLFKSHNTLTQDYKCFQFDEPSLFADQIGPAYKEDLYEDMKIDNGLNSVNSKIMRIKVLKIKVAKQLDEEGKKFSDSEEYWYNSDSGTVYDLELHYAIGKVKMDESGIPQKLSSDVYIMDRMIPIPMLKEKKQK